ncbi:MAG: hypothetical protein GTO71_08365 [Woeseiaceae bacterium]|nr:hypothetical protein [Woeseiaceae bacterium]NIP21098.1 hypothetical protein [Woeseiaceae bacterium]NIS90070.1 hypothetical protein [Woeseiaceae bacterium]
MSRFIGILALLLPVSVLGDDPLPIHPYLSSKYYASVGLFLPDQDVKLSLDATLSVPEGAIIPYYDFSQTFGTKTSDETFSAEIGWRFGKKWQLRGQYFRVEDKATATLEEDVEWGEYIFNSGSSVGAGTDMQVTRLFFGRHFRSTETGEFGLGIGSHILDISAYLEGNATLSGQDVGFVEERASISQPLPNFGAWYMHAFSAKLAVMVRLDWLSASFDKYDGRIVNAAASLGYSVGDHFGIGLAYNFFEIDFKIDDEDWRGGIRTRFNGPYISLTGYW